MTAKSGGEKLVQLSSGIWVPESIAAEEKASAQAAAKPDVAARPTEAMKQIGGKKMGRGRMAAYAMAAAAVVGLGVAGYKYMFPDKDSELPPSRIDKNGEYMMTKDNEHFLSISLYNAFTSIQADKGLPTKAKTGMGLAETNAVLHTIKRNKADIFSQLDKKGEATAQIVQIREGSPYFEYYSAEPASKEAKKMSDPAIKDKSTVVTFKLSKQGTDFEFSNPGKAPVTMHYDGDKYTDGAYAGKDKEAANPKKTVAKPAPGM